VGNILLCDVGFEPLIKLRFCVDNGYKVFFYFILKNRYKVTGVLAESDEVLYG
jgi:hypothetical protein